MTTVIQPLLSTQKITNGDGTPSLAFMRLLQTNGGILGNTTDTTIKLAAATLDVSADFDITEGGLFIDSPALSLAPTGVTAGSYTNANVTVDANGRVTEIANGTSAATLTVDYGGSSFAATSVLRLTGTGWTAVTSPTTGEVDVELNIPASDVYTFTGDGVTVTGTAPTFTVDIPGFEGFTVDGDPGIKQLVFTGDLAVTITGDTATIEHQPAVQEVWAPLSTGPASAPSLVWGTNGQVTMVRIA